MNTRVRHFHTFAVISVSIALVVIFAFPAAAADDQNKFTIENPLGKGTTFVDVITRITGFANDVMVPLAALMILISAYLYMTSGGDPEKLKTAHKSLIYALVGIAIVLLSNGAELIIKDVLKVP